MDGYSMGLILRQLLAAGLPLKSIIGVVLSGGGVYAAYKSVLGILAFFQRYSDNRDAQMGQLAQDLRASEERRAALDRDRAALDRETAGILAVMRTDISKIEILRAEMHQRFNKVQEDVTTIKGAVS